MNGELRQSIPFRLIKYIFIFVNFARSETGRLLRLSTDACHFTQYDSFEVVSHLKDMFKVKATINLDNQVSVTINMRLYSNPGKKLPVLFKFTPIFRLQTSGYHFVWFWFSQLFQSTRSPITCIDSQTVSLPETPKDLHKQICQTCAPRF